MLARLLSSALTLGVTVSLLSCTANAAPKAPIPAPTADASLTAVSGKQSAVFAGGCFWGTQSVFQRVKGVIKTTAGYAGGSKSTASYDQVTTETTGHAESVEVVYDPSKITYGQLLRVYFSVAHDPTQLNRQGPDVGTSYRSAIFPQSKAQADVARAYIAQLAGAHAFSQPIVTKLEAGGFYPAEAYHQDFMRKHPQHPYIVAHDVPKVRALSQLMPALVKA